MGSTSPVILIQLGITDREDIIKESIEDDVDHNDITQETELQALSEDLLKEIDETPPTQEEIEVIEEIISIDSMVISSGILLLLSQHT